MLHQISLYLAEQWELRTVTLWPPFNGTQCISCHSPWWLSRVCATCMCLPVHEHMPALFSFFLFLKHMYLQLFESLLQIQPASMCVCLFPSGLYPKMTVLQNINLIWSLLWPRLYLSKLPLIELLFSQPLGSCYQGGLCLSAPISLGDWVDRLQLIRLFYIMEHLTVMRSHNNIICTQRNHKNIKGISSRYQRQIRARACLQ